MTTLDQKILEQEKEIASFANLETMFSTYEGAKWIIDNIERLNVKFHYVDDMSPNKSGDLIRQYYIIVLLKDQVIAREMQATQSIKFYLFHATKKVDNSILSPMPTILDWTAGYYDTFLVSTHQVYDPSNQRVIKMAGELRESLNKMVKLLDNNAKISMMEREARK